MDFLVPIDDKCKFDGMMITFVLGKKIISSPPPFDDLS